MRITKGTDRRKGKISDRIINEMLAVVCDGARIDKDSLTVNVVGPRRPTEMKLQGVKFSHPMPFSVQALLRYRGEAILAHIAYEMDGRSISGESLFNTIVTAYDGSKLLEISDEELRTGRRLTFAEKQVPVIVDPRESSKEVDESTEHPSDEAELPFGQDGVTNLGSPDIARDETSSDVDKAISMKLGTPSSAMGRISERAPFLLESAFQNDFRTEGDVESEENNHSVLFRFFEKKENLHLAVVALVSAFEIGRPFSYRELETVLLREVLPNVPGLDTRHVRPTIRVFTKHGFIRRLNPDARPARYTLEDTAVSFAHSEVAEKTRIDSPKRVEVNADELTERISDLRKASEQWATLSDEITALEEHLKCTKDPVEESAEAEKEIEALTQMITELKVRKVELTASAEERRRQVSRIGALRVALNDPLLKGRHDEYLRVKALIA